MKENYWIGGQLEPDNLMREQTEHLVQEKRGREELGGRDGNRGIQLHGSAKRSLSPRSESVFGRDEDEDFCENNNNNNNNDNKRSNHSSICGSSGHGASNSNSTSSSTSNTNSSASSSDEDEPTRLFREKEATKQEVREQSSRLDRRERVDVKKQRRRRQRAKKEEKDVNLSFCGCGFLGIYHVGVASCFHQYAPQLSMHKISGSSAGALVAVAHICGNLQLAYATTDILRVAIDARARALGPFHPSFDISATVREALERGLPEDVHLRASGKLHVSLTRVCDGQNVIISEFATREEVIQVLLCSCFIPLWSGLVAPKFKGVTYIDGGFSNNLLILDDKTVTVSPFAGESDICPQDDTFNLLQVSLSNTSFSISPNNLYRLSHALLPPPPEVLSDLCEQGFADGIRFLQRMKLISCTKCLEIRSSLLVTTNGQDMEEAFTNQVNSVESMKSTSSFSENHHIRLEQQEQKMIEINERQRRNSIVSTTSQLYSQQSSHCLVYTEEEFEDSWSGADYGDEHCDECVLIRQKALYEPQLPEQFSDRIRDACDAVNKSLSNWIYSHRPIKYLSYLAAPYYLPVDISFALVAKCWRRLPFIRSEILDCIYRIVEFLLTTLRTIHSRSTSELLIGVPGGEWDGNARVDLEKEAIKQQTDKVRPSRAARGLVVGRQISCASATNEQATKPALTCPGDVSVKITSEGVRVLKCKSSRNSTTSTVANGNNNNNNGSSNSNSSGQVHSLEDTFDSIVDVTSNQEARIFAYYFRDAKDRLQVTEIFDLERAAELSSNLMSTTQGLNQNQSQLQHQSQRQTFATLPAQAAKRPGNQASGAADVKTC